MRVATRRMRAAMRMFLDVLPARSAHLLEEVGWLAGELGVVRDLDVQLVQIAQWQAETEHEIGRVSQSWRAHSSSPR